MVHGFTEENHIVLFRWYVIQYLALDKLVLARSAGLNGPLPCLGKCDLRYIHTEVALIGAIGQLVGRVARTTSKIQNAALSGPLFQEWVHTVIGRVVVKAPLVSRVFLVPEGLLQEGWAIAHQCPSNKS